MRTKLNFGLKFLGFEGICLALLGLVFLAAPGLVSAQQYQGAQYCQECHEDQYRAWLTAGHRFILMEAKDAEHRTLSVPEGKSWDDFSYVIGGNKTKALYVDNQGNIYAPARGKNQYNVLTGTWTDYHAGETVPYDCAECHTTGYQAGGSPAGLPGISGTFALPGVQCEHCHGPGDDMESGNTDPSFCGTCHRNSDNVNTIAAADGFIKSEGQYNEFLAGPHASLDCVSCHNPHMNAEVGIKRECSSCHADVAASYAGTTMDNYAVECEDCHMPYATLSAEPLGPHQGDERTHIFSINTDANGAMFSADGQSVAMSGGKAAVTMDFACQRCHDTASLSELAKFAKDFHDTNKGLTELDPGLSGTWWGGPTRDGEGFVLEVGYANGNIYLFGSFYSYDNMGNQVYLVALLTSTSGTTTNVDFYITEGRVWGADFDPTAGNTIKWGSGTFTFPTCGSGSFTMVPNATYAALGFTNLSYSITRLITPGIACPTFNNNG